MESIYWVISKDCNQHCPHCYNNSRPGGPGLSQDQVSQIVAHLPDGNNVLVKKIIIGGGEVLVWEGLLLHTLDELRRRFGARTRLEIQTNGDLLTARNLAVLVDHGLDSVSVASMDAYHATSMPTNRKPRS
jgi:MoaA/NifB/PqqE/SkfB family radical SAM enzyme